MAYSSFIVYHLTATETRMSMGSHSVTCHPTETTIPALTQTKLALD